MKLTLLIVELVISLFLVFAILLHSPKGEGLGAIGGQARMFRAQKGMEDGLNKLTTWLAVAFLGLALVLSFLF